MFVLFFRVDYDFIEFTEEAVKDGLSFHLPEYFFEQHIGELKAHIDDFDSEVEYINRHIGQVDFPWLVIIIFISKFLCLIYLYEVANK